VRLLLLLYVAVVHYVTFYGYIRVVVVVAVYLLVTVTLYFVRCCYCYLICRCYLRLVPTLRLLRVAALDYPVGYLRSFVRCGCICSFGCGSRLRCPVVVDLVTLFWLIVYRLLRSRLYVCYVVVVAVTLFVTLRVPGYARSPRFGCLVIVGWLLPLLRLLQLLLVVTFTFGCLFTRLRFIYIAVVDVTLVTFVTLRCWLFGLHTRTHCCWILRLVHVWFAVVGCTLLPHVAVCYVTFIAVTGLIWLLPLIYGLPHTFILLLRYGCLVGCC